MKLFLYCILAVAVVVHGCCLSLASPAAARGDELPEQEFQVFADPWLPSAAVADENGIGHLAVESRVGRQSDVFYVQAQGSTSLLIENVSDNEVWSTNPEIHVAGGVVYMVWQDVDQGIEQVFLRERRNGVWGPVLQASASLTGAQRPHISVSQQGELLIEWVEYTRDERHTRQCTWQGIGCSSAITVAAEKLLPDGMAAGPSADLQTVAYIRDGDIWSVREDGTGARQITRTGTVSAFAWSPTGWHIAYTSRGGEIYVMEGDGSNLKQITTDARARGFDIDWVGSRVFFVRDYDKVSYVDVSTLDGRVVDVSIGVPFYGYGIHHPAAWPTLRRSPDGKWLVFEVYPVYGLGVVQRDGTGYRQLEGWEPDWKHDSSRIVHVDPGISLTDPATGQTSLLAGVCGEFASYSPDDAYLVYTCSDLRRMNSDGTGEILLSYVRAADPAWSPRGDKIVYGTWSPDEWGFFEYEEIYVIGADGSGRKWLGTGNHPAWQPEPSGFAGDLAAFVEHSNAQIAALTDTGDNVATVGDYYLDKLEIDRVRAVVNVFCNSLSLLTVDWSLVGKGVERMAVPGSKAALKASWKGWVEEPAARHWYKPLYDRIHHDRKLLYDKTLSAGLNYYAGETIKEGSKEWLPETLSPGPGTPVADSFATPGRILGEAYQRNLAAELYAMLEELPLTMPSAQAQALYRDDLLARRSAHESIVAQMTSHRDLLWHSYLDTLADEAKWWKFWGGLLAKWAVVGAATLAFDGPGYAVASAGMGTLDLIYESVRDVRTLQHDQQLLDQSLRFFTGKMSISYQQISLNTVNALNMIRADDQSMLPEANVGILSKESYGQYRLLPLPHWSEEKSQIGIPIHNPAPFETSYSSSAVYDHTTFWAGTERLLPEGAGLDLVSGRNGTATIEFNAGDRGTSPDEGSLVDLLVLGSTDSGMYRVYSAQTVWTPTRYTSSTRSSAAAPAGYTEAQAAQMPTYPYPLSSSLVTEPGSTDHIVALSAINPFFIALSAVLTQPIPAEFVVLDDCGGQLADGALVWSAVLEPGASLECHVVLEWEPASGETATLPGAVLALETLDTGLVDFYMGDAMTVEMPWALETKAKMPSTWRGDEPIALYITLANRARTVAFEGQLAVSASSPSGEMLWSSTRSVVLDPRSLRGLLLPFEISSPDNFVVVQGEMTSGSERRTLFLEILPRREVVFLPMISSNTAFGR